MRIVPNKILSILAIISTSVAFAAPMPPAPGIPTPPDVPVDSGTAFLVVAAILLGFYKMYQFKINKKAPM